MEPTVSTLNKCTMLGREILIVCTLRGEVTLVMLIVEQLMLTSPLQT